MNRRPKRLEGRQHRISIICEGFEEESYLKRLEKLSLWSPVYKFKFINAKTASNILNRYEYEHRNDGSELALVFCDTDRPPYQGYNNLRTGIGEILKCTPEEADSVLMYANPCTMQLMLMHFNPDVRLTTQNKKKNASLIAEHTGVQDYDAHREQIDALCGLINRENYSKMRSALQSIDKPWMTVPSTNFGRFLDFFHSDDVSWIKRVNDKIRQ